jgi:hypothetical protein
LFYASSRSTRKREAKSRQISELLAWVGVSLFASCSLPFVFFEHARRELHTYNCRLQRCHLDIFSASVSTLEAKPVPTELQSSSQSSFILQCMYLS